MANTESGLFIDGALVTVDDLTFREQREMREFARDLAPDGDLEIAGEIDMIPAMVCVVRRRTDPEFTIEQALDMKGSDLEVPPTPPRRRK